MSKNTDCTATRRDGEQRAFQERFLAGAVHAVSAAGYMFLVIMTNTVNKIELEIVMELAYYTLTGHGNKEKIFPLEASVSTRPCPRSPPTTKPDAEY